jgi:hypothetical protein
MTQHLTMQSLDLYFADNLNHWPEKDINPQMI